MAWKRPRGKPVETLTRRQHLLSTAVSVLVGFVVMAATRNVIFGLLTFLLSGILVNAVMALRTRR